MVELVITVAITSVLLIGVATIFANSWTTQGDVTTVTRATNQGQLVGSMIERAVRNGLFVDFDDSGGEDVLRVRTSLGGSLQCQGFAVGDTLRVITSDGSAGPIPTWSAWPEWNPVITIDEDQSSISRAGDVVTYWIVIDTESAPVRIIGEVSSRSTAETAIGGSPCW